VRSIAVRAAYVEAAEARRLKLAFWPAVVLRLWQGRTMCSMAVAHVLTLAAQSWGLRVVVSEFFEDACTRHGKIPFSRNLPAALRQLPTTRPPTLGPLPVDGPLQR
jgi:hypothetical protein